MSDGVRRSRGASQPVHDVERAVVAHLTLATDVVAADVALDEVRALTEAAGVRVVGVVQQNRRFPDPATFFGSGRVDELKDVADRNAAGVVVFGSDLSPTQGVNLEKRLGRRVVDRSQLIMDLFAARARTHQAHLQVELAQLEYSLPRLKRMWTHLDRQKGGIGMRGPGETQIELDRREILKKISDRRRRLRDVERSHELRRLGRHGRFTVGLIGYTNAGKSTLFNRLTASDVLAEDRPFTTLDTKTSAWRVEPGCTVLLSDTVGFVRNLPHHLVASFHATLQEALEADLLLHVVDGSRPDAALLIDAVHEVLAEIGGGERPRLLVVNKVDRLSDRTLLAEFGADAVALSAVSGEGLDELARRVARAARSGHDEVELRVPFDQGAAIAALRARAEILESRDVDDGWFLRVRAPQELVGRLRRFVVDGAVDSATARPKRSS